MGTVKYIFKSLYSNQTIIEGRHRPWFIAIIFFILSCVLTWIPVLYSGYTTDNSEFFTGTSSQEVDRGIRYMMEQDYFREGIVINQNRETGDLELNFDGLNSEEFYRSDVWDNEYNGSVTEDDAPLIRATFNDVDSAFLHSSIAATNQSYDYYFDAIAIDTTDLITDTTDEDEDDDDEDYENNSVRSVILEVYFLPDVRVEDDDEGDIFSDYLNNFISGIVLGANSAGSATRYSHSYIIFTPDVVSIAIAPIQGVLGGSYDSSSTGYIADGLSSIGASEYETLYSALTDYIDGVEITTDFEAFARFFHNSVQATNIFSTWVNVGVLCAVVAGLELISALIIFFFHRRKVSAYRDVSYWTAMKEAMTLGFTPCVLGMAFGFLGYTYNLMLIIAGILLRTIWMNNKICPPTQQEDKPLYKARS